MPTHSIYKSYSPEQLENLASNYLLSTWSFSKLMAFSRNQMGFEMNYLWNEKSRSSATTIAGQAYHYALDQYFTAKIGGTTLSLPELEAFAFQYIDDVPANTWQLQKTLPTVEEAIADCNKSVIKLLENFYAEKYIYEDDIKEILYVEVYIVDYLRINGVDIPIPCAIKADLVVRTVRDTIAIIDHKSKKAFTDDNLVESILLLQLVLYAIAVESHYEIKIDEVWIVENKISKNKDQTIPQLKAHKFILDDDSRRLNEAKLYQNLKVMIDAVSEPDFVYMRNYSDNLIDQSELDIFWAKTQIAEIGDFDIEESKVPLLEKRLKKIKDTSIQTVSPQVIKNFQKNASKFIQYDLSSTNMTTAQKIEHVLRTKNITVNVAQELNGYSSNTYLLEFSAGTNISSIYGKRLDIANALNVPNVRIPNNLTIFEGKSYMAVETSKKREKDLIWDKNELVGMKIPLGKDNMGNLIYWDLENESTANKFTSGSVGSGKSVNIISDLEYALLIDKIAKFVIFDPKREFTKYSSHKKVTVYNEYLDMENAMKELVDEMDEKIRNGIKEYVFVIVEEYADILGNVRRGKELDIIELVQDGFYAPKKMMGIPMPPEPKMKMKKTGQHASFEENFMKLAQKGRSSGFRIDGATQISSADVLTSKIKVNFPVIVCFRMPKEANSRVALDESGAETLTGAGDGLIKSPDFPEVTRFQAFYKP